MSGMSPDEAGFATIVGKLVSTDMDVRRRAEASYDTIPADKKIVFLLALVENQQAPEDLKRVCQLLSQLLKAHFKFAWNALNEEMQAQVKTKIVHLLSREAEQFTIRKKLAGISEVSAYCANFVITDLITALAEICEILGEPFANYLPMVMAPVLRTASIKPELAMLDPDDVKDVDIGLQMEDKDMACQTLASYARVMKNHFRPYVDEVVKLVIPLLKFCRDEGVRSSSAEIVPHLLRCVDDNPNDKVTLWNMVKNDLLIAAEAEPDSDVKCDQLSAIASCINLLPPEAVDQETTNKITNVVEKVFLKHFDRSAERAEQRKEEDYDEGDEMTGDYDVLATAAGVLQSMLKVHGVNYLPFMEAKIFGLVVKLISPDRYWQERESALWIWDHVMQFTGPASANYQNHFIPLLLQYLGDESPEVRQAASYGCGVMAQYGQDAFVVVCKEALPGLVRIVNDAESRMEWNIMATENAISAVAKIIKFCPSAVSMDEVIPLWTSWLPIWEYTNEMDSVYGLLCDLVESNHPIVLGPNGSNLPRILHIIAETFYRKSLDHDSTSRPRIVNIIRTLQMSYPAVLQQCTAVLNPELQAALQAGLA